VIRKIKLNASLILVRILLLIPEAVFLFFLRSLSQLVFSLRPAYKQIVKKNLALAFPEYDSQFEQRIFDGIHSNMAFLVYDTLRLSVVDRKWLVEHCVLEDPEGFINLRKKYGEVGALFCSAHLNSFEVLPSYLSMHFRTTAVIVREHASEWLNDLMEYCRTNNDVESIPRTGGLRRMVKRLKAGKNVGLLFDQNVVRKDGIFVPWFGKPAATTVALGFAALQTRCPIVICAIKRTADRRYLVRIKDLEYLDILENPVLSNEEKMEQITLRSVQAMEQYILDDVENWFWMHRRWKTRPEGETAKFY
jgi:KDO2-lipid IV(A) lauroyltransferase